MSSERHYAVMQGPALTLFITSWGMNLYLRSMDDTCCQKSSIVQGKFWLSSGDNATVVTNVTPPDSGLTFFDVDQITESAANKHLYHLGNRWRDTHTLHRICSAQ